MTPLVADIDFTLYVGEIRTVLSKLPSQSVDAVVTSPPYLDVRPEYDSPTMDDYRRIFIELARVCKGGMAWNVGRLWRDGVESLWWTGLIEEASHAGWQHWDTMVWVKPNANPIKGNLMADSHEYVLMFGRDGVEFYPDMLRTDYADGSVARMKRKWLKGNTVKGYDEAVALADAREPNELGARGRSYTVVYVGKDKGIKHPAPMALGLAYDLVPFVCPANGVVLDPFMGSGTTAVAARALGMKSVGIELNEVWASECADRLQQQSLFAT